MLVAARSAVALHRLLDTLPVFSGDARITRFFTLVPGSDFSVDALAAISAAGARSVPWDEACRRSFDLILTASPKGELQLLHGDRVLLPHGAGFGKAIQTEGSAGAASGLDPAHLLPDDEALALYALAHSDQVARLAQDSPQIAQRARVVGDPTLERFLASRSLRERYRAALGTGARRLVVLASTWGPESLLRRRANLPAELMAQLPYDAYQIALVVHPNERSRLSAYELREHLAPALDAGLLLPEPYEGWAALLVAADAMICDHGSAALYFAAVDDRPVINAYDGGVELIPDSAIASLLSAVPRLERPARIQHALDAYRPGSARPAVQAAFAEQGYALQHLRRELYALLGLTPPALPVTPRPLPLPEPALRTAGAFDVHARVAGHQTCIERVPAGLGPAGHHLAAEYNCAGERHVRTAAVLYRRGSRPEAAVPYSQTWTAAAWTAHTLAEYPSSRLAAAVLTNELCLLRLRQNGLLWAVHIEPHVHRGTVVHADPAAALSAVHAWRVTNGQMPEEALECRLGEHTFEVRVCAATEDEAGRLV
ncbi:translation initiation factor 2 [Streptomyces sp. NPDC058644]|uniref:translation initiation factor 2 n=1 Tax=unclassified Streptomyces TaxID=2593676 RepID=UPI003655191C